MDKLALVEKEGIKSKLPEIRPGDIVRVEQIIYEGDKKRKQLFEGRVIRFSRPKSLTATILVRKISSGVGVEKSWLVNSPNVVKIEVVKRSKVRRAFLSYLRKRQGKATKLTEVEFDADTVNVQEEKSATKAQKTPDEAQLVEESTEDLKKAEDKQSAKDDSDQEKDSEDEQQLAAQEFQEGVDKAENEMEENA